MNPMTPEEFEQRMKEQYPPAPDKYDEEVSHGEADRLMCQVLRDLGYDAGVAVFENARRWYS